VSPISNRPLISQISNHQQFASQFGVSQPVVAQSKMGFASPTSGLKKNLRSGPRPAISLELRASIIFEATGPPHPVLNPQNVKRQAYKRLQFSDTHSFSIPKPFEKTF